MTVPQTSKPNLSRTALGLFVLALASIFFAQRQAEADLLIAWQTEEYSHGMLIPFISLLLAWHELSDAKPILKPSWLGLIFLFVAGSMQLVARLSAFDTIAEYGLILSIAGCSLAFLGRSATRAIMPALIYLIFAIPLPHIVQANLSENLQLISSSLGVWPLDVLGIPVYQEGNVIDLGGYRLQVVEACNGLRYLFPLMSFGYLAALLLKDRFWKRAIVFLSTIPITIGMNALRIAFIGVTVDLWGQDMAEGFIHSFEGWTVFLSCVVLLMLEIWILLKVGTRGHFRYEYLGRAKGPLVTGGLSLRTPALAAVAAALLLAFLFGAEEIDQHTEIVPKHPPLSSFPLTVSDWTGRQESLPEDVLKALQLSDYWIADYRNSATEAPIDFYIAYYDSQRVGVTTHSPSNCIPGGGWLIDKSDTPAVQLSSGLNFDITRLIIKKGEHTQVIYYWFDERGRTFTNTYSAKLYLLLDSITMHRSDGALIRLSTPVVNETLEVAEKRLDGFLDKAYPDIRRFIPGKDPNEALTSSNQ